MNKQICIFILLLTCRICEAQNLVPNPSFEDTTNCPFYYPTNSALPWFNPNIASPDYFTQDTSACGNHLTNSQFNGQSGWGHQLPRTGVAYSGVYIQLSPTREYIETKLIDTLQAGQTYFVSFYISRAEYFNLAADRIGAYFSDTAIVVSYFHEIPVIPQIENPAGNIISDTTNWVNIQGTFVANGTETHMIIGNFRNDAQTQTATITTNGPAGYSAYYFIDDVSVTIATSINESIQNTSANIYPSPFNDVLNIQVSNRELSEIIIYDISSRIVFNQSFSNSTKINTAKLVKGIYLYEVRNKNGVIKKGKVVKD